MIKLPENFSLTKFRRLFRYGLVLSIFVLAVTTSLFVNRERVYLLLTKTPIPAWLRDSGILKTNVPDFFLALETQNPIYDYNGDGVITRADYPALLGKVGAQTETLSSVEPLATTAEDASAQSVALPSVKAFGNDAFNGVATVSYPIDLPTGTGGLTRFERGRLVPDLGRITEKQSTVASRLLP